MFCVTIWTGNEKLVPGESILNFYSVLKLWKIEIPEKTMVWIWNCEFISTECFVKLMFGWNVNSCFSTAQKCDFLFFKNPDKNVTQTLWQPFCAKMFGWQNTTLQQRERPDTKHAAHHFQFRYKNSGLHYNVHCTNLKNWISEGHLISSTFHLQTSNNTDKC